MSDIKHRINLGANTVVDVDGALPTEFATPFLVTSTDIYVNSLTRTVNETL